MYKFTIEYYFSRYHTGELNTRATRKCVVTAANRQEAINKVVEADSSAISIANMQFEEVQCCELCKQCRAKTEEAL